MKTNKISQLFLVFLAVVFVSCQAQPVAQIITGAERTTEYISYLEGKKVGVMANQTSRVGSVSLVDTLVSLGLDVRKIYCPEHGFRGDASDGEVIESGKDARTGLPIISLYSTKRKPTPEDLEGIDILVFDIQDVGMRFYTYISTLHYVMEACAENNIEVMVLDRPNPHGFYTDGPILDTAYRSFVGMHPVPVVHGMTIAEYAKMINGERWLANGMQCKLKTIACTNYTHDSLYQLPVRPSPNLPNMTAIYLYPSLCFFEGTVVSLGRGTDFPFQVYGHPLLTAMNFSFIPLSRQESINPPLINQLCYGVDLRNYNTDSLILSRKINLGWVISAYALFPDKDNFFRPYFDTLAGSDKLRRQITGGMSEAGIRETWEEGLAVYRLVRRKYLLYPEETH
ncbi:MAG: DUF1343 domain-containing protein [Bacteroidales bacterium]|nr:DUF1343 domain-containing protein [Bacteroidales bacterium]